MTSLRRSLRAVSPIGCQTVLRSAHRIENLSVRPQQESDVEPRAVVDQLELGAYEFRPLIGEELTKPGDTRLTTRRLRRRAPFRQGATGIIKVLVNPP